MDTLNTAEGVTRFLRAKGGSLDKIVLTANQILDDTINVHLPNKHIFIFDLLCDRFNDNNHFKNWKYDTQCWILFRKVWIGLDNDKISRNRSMKKLKFVDLLTNILKNSNQKADVKLLENVMQTTNIVMNDFYIEIDDNSSINLLASYVTSLTHLYNEINFSDEIINDWTDVIYKLYQIPQLNVNYKYSKKSVTKFFGEFIPPALHFIKSEEEKSNLSQSKTIIQNIICKVIFNKDSIGGLKGNIELLLSKYANDISFESLKYLFVLVINNLSSKDMKLCEEVFLSIINTKKFNQMSETLLEILSSVNKSLSTEFFSSIYDKEVKSNSKNNINWSLVIHLFNLDIELAMNNAEEVLSNIPSSVNSKTILDIGKSVAEAYIKAREFVEFFQNIWINIIRKASIWRSSEFIDIISSKINNLSTNQLNILLSFSFGQSDALPLTNSIIKGLLICPLNKVESVKKLLLSQSKLFTEPTSSFWEIRFYILCLYNEEVLENNPKFISYVSNSPVCSSEYYYYTIFRLIEITGNDGSFNQYNKDFVKYLKTLKSDKIRYVLMTLFNRWLVLIDKFFSKSQTLEIMRLYLNQLDFGSYLLNYFENNGDVFFEQRNMVDALLIILIENFANGINDGSVGFINLISVIPVQCFDKYSKKKLIDAIFGSFSCSQDNDVNVSSRVALRHLLIQPSFKSSIELDFKLSLKLMETSVQTSLQLSNEILQSIWNQNLSQYSVETNKTYILESIQYLNDFFKGFKTKNILELPSEFQAALVIILTNTKHKNTDNNLEGMIKALINLFVKTTKELLHKIIESKKNINYEIVCWLLNSLYLTSSDDSEEAHDIRSLIKMIGQKLPSAHNDQINKVRVILFKLLTNVSGPSFNDAVFISSLFISLDVKFGADIDEMTMALMSYLDKISANEDDFKMFYEFVLHSVNTEEDPRYMSSLVRITNSLIKSLNREYQADCTTLFIKTLSVFLTQYKLISLSGHNSIVSILSTLKTSLSGMTWCFNQYALETTISLITRVSYSLSEPEFAKLEHVVDIYIQLTHVMSNILLFHRFKLSSRHHIIINACVSLLAPVSIKNLKSENNYLSSSTKATGAYSRLLSNLCEPSNTSSKEMVQSSLNSTSALIKRSLRKHLPILLLNYINIALKNNFKSEVNDELMGGIFSIFNVLSQTELRLVSSSLDIPGKTYYRTLYADYKEHGKWKDE